MNDSDFDRHYVVTVCLSVVLFTLVFFVVPAGAQSSLPICNSSASDTDGDGYGWENKASCRVVGGDQLNTNAQSSSHLNGQSFPVCSSANADSDGDGYGWENNESCVVIGNGTVVQGWTTGSTGAPNTTSNTTSVVRLSARRDPLERNVATASCDTSSSSVRIIDSIADLADLDNPNYRVFCIANGDYRSAGVVRLTSSGTANQPRILRPLQNWPNGIDNAVQLPESQRVRFQRMELLGARHWVIDGVAIDNGNRSTSLANITLMMRDNASDNTVYRSLIEGGRIGLRMIRSHRNTLQRNVVRRTILLPNADSNCINIGGDAGQVIHGNRIVSNEAYDCTDSLQLVARPDATVKFPGTVIANNDFYLTNAVYTDCRGNPDRNGRCSAAEGRLDIKGGGTGASDAQRVRVLRNRIWGSRVTDPVLGGSSWGSGIAICCGSDIAHVTIEDNIVFDVDRGITVAGANTRSINVSNNRLIRIGSSNGNSGHALLALEGTSATRWTNNIVYRAKTWGLFRGNGQTVRCNTMLDAGNAISSANTNIGSNYFYGNSHPPSGYNPDSSDYLGHPVSLSGHTNLCFTRRQLTSPQQQCLPNAAMSQSSPHRGACVAQ